ncbi:MAG: hypothetical protein EBT03_10310 [Betaproteobacteria bacterium]|nr:hypothetical protein [Betaproteobacteria bacterium]
MTPKQATVAAINERKRIPELEHVVLQSPWAACVYAMRVVKGEWEEAEKVIASASLNVALYGFDSLDVQVSRYERPKAEWIVKNKNQNLYIAYTTLVRKRCQHIEKKFESERCYYYGYRYSKLIYRMTKEIVDLNDPRICVHILKDISSGKFARRLNREERLRICNELHGRMLLHSFSNNTRDVREYFARQKKTENDFLIMLSQHDENMTVGDLIRKMTA